MINTLIEKIDEATNDAQQCVVEHLLDSYDKALMILEHYDNDDLSTFAIFQESYVQEADNTSNNKQQAKRGILGKIFGIIPRLINNLRASIAKHFEDKKMKALEKKAKKLNVDLDKLSDSEKEMLGGILNNQLSEKDINKLLTMRKLKSLGLKVGAGAIVVGGSAYYLNQKKELVIEKANEFKGKIYKKLDDEILSGVRNAANEAVDKISATADAAAEKIKAAANACKKAFEAVIKFIKRLYESFKKFFNVSLFKYEQTDVENVLCKIDANTGTLYVTFDIDTIMLWIKATKTFISNAVLFVGREFKDGELIKHTDETGKAVRDGAINDIQKQHRENSFRKSGAQFVADYRKDLQKLADKFNAKSEYHPIDIFTTKATKLIGELNSVCDLVNKLSEHYKNRMNVSSRDQNSNLAAEQEVAVTLRGILDTQLVIINSVDAINSYIDITGDMLTTMEL